MSQYTDHLGQPISAGDKIVYPDQRGTLNLGEVHALIPLVPYPGAPVDYRGVPQYAREDQVRGSKPPTAFKGKLYDNPAKRYVIQVFKEMCYWSSDPNRRKLQKYTLPTTQVAVVPADAEVS